MNLKIKFTKMYDWVINFVMKNKILIFVVCITIIALFLRYSFIGYESSDYQIDLSQWCEYLEKNGGFLAIKSIQSDYNVSYLYFLALFTYLPFSYLAKIKFLSILFEIICAFFVYKIVKKLGSYSDENIVPYVAYAVTLFVPTVIMNGAIWAQSDIIYTTFIIISILCLIEEKYIAAFVLYGLALSFKLQAIFVLPLYLALYFKLKKFSILNFLIIPMIYFLVYFPALLLGKPLSQLFSAYSTQVIEYGSTVKNFANLYILIPNNYYLFFRGGMALGIAVLGIVFFLILSNDRLVITGNTVVEIAMVFIMICTYFFPAIHERYMFAVDILAVIYLFNHKNRFYIPLLIWFINASCYMPYLFSYTPWLDFKILAIINLSVLVLLLKDIFFMGKQTNAY